MLPIFETTLPNGLRVVIAPLPHLHTVCATFSVRGGSRYEQPEDHGLSHVVEHMIFRGTDMHPDPYDLNLAVEEIGGGMDAATHVDFVQYQLELPSESLAVGLAAFSRIFHAPRFQGLEVEKAILREELLSDLDEDGRDVEPDNIARRLLFGDHPLGRTITGDLDRVASFTVADLERHFAAHYVARNAALCIAGAVEPEAGMRLAMDCFGGLTPGAAARYEPAPDALPEQRFRVVSSPDNQTDVRISFDTIGDVHADAMALRMLERVLDDGLASRLHRRICDEQGLSYHLFAGLDPYEDRGAFDLGATVGHEKVPTVVDSMLSLVEEIGDHGVGEAELERAVKRHRWDLEALLDAAADVSSYYAHFRLFGRPDTLETLAADAARVTTADVERLARTWLRRERARVACVGRVGERAKREIRKSLRIAEP
jgi:predicted Zn-dependent peptidase